MAPDWKPLVTFITLSCQTKVTNTSHFKMIYSWWMFSRLNVSVYLCCCCSHMWGKSAPCGALIVLKSTVYSRHKYLIVNSVWKEILEDQFRKYGHLNYYLLQHRFQAHHLQCLFCLTKVFIQSNRFYISYLSHWSCFFIMCLLWICQLQFCVFTSDHVNFNFRHCCDFYELLYIVFKQTFRP